MNANFPFFFCIAKSGLKAQWGLLISFLADLVIWTLAQGYAGAGLSINQIIPGSTGASSARARA
jgi:hypothetical protein